MRNAPVGRAALPLLLAALAGCQSGGGAATDAKQPKPTGTPVYEVRLDDQLQAASKATTASGSSAFTWTLSYGSAKGTAVDRTTGTQDYAKKTARAERTVTVPRRFPEDAAGDLGGTPGGPGAPGTYLVDGNDVTYETRKGDWLRYSASAPKEMVDFYDGVLQYAGDAAPYGRTLAEVVRHADAQKQPAKGADGSRTYTLSVPPQTAAAALPVRLENALLYNDDAERVPLTVVLDGEGRLTSATADYTPALKALHDAGRLKGVTSLKAEYRLTRLGAAPVPAPPAAAKAAADAEKAVTPLAQVAPGACGSADTGLGGSLQVVRVVPCGAGADLRVFGQVKIKEKLRGQQDPDALATRKARDKCERAYGAAPKSWTADGRPAGGFYTYGSAANSYAYVGPDVDVDGTFTCYVRTSRD
ncbi:hypothetical protein [Streptomyces fradiae]|uniref:hypothetical protein n=1 Tax=Streptomyces fradiae TaxID=1906 RepID=UPI0035136E74